MLNRVSTADAPFPIDLIASMDRCYRMHRENRIKIMNGKLACYILIGGGERS